MNPAIPGVVLSGSEPNNSPVAVVIAREKTGKSVLAVTLKNWPYQGAEPLVLAFDETGPDSAAKLGYPLHCLRPFRETGAQTRAGQLRLTATKLEQAFKGKAKPPYSAIVVDCVSTAAESLLEEIGRTSKNPNKLGHYGEMNDALKSFFWRVTDLGVPTVWLAWLAEPHTKEEKGVSRYVPGGPMIPGDKFKGLLAGKAHAIAYLERRVPMPDDPPEFLCSDGNARLFHTKVYGGINCEGRYNVPSPLPAHLGWLFYYIMHSAPQAAQPINGAMAQHLQQPMQVQR